MNKDAKILVLGGGLVGSAILNVLCKHDYKNIFQIKSKQELDLTNQAEVDNLFSSNFDFVFLCAAKVGGIIANNLFKADFIYQNLQIQNNVIFSCFKYKVKKLLFLGSSCIYPKNCKQPMKEEYLLSGYLEETNDAYAIAKIAGLKMCQSFNEQYGTNFLCVMPTNLYGPYDNYDPVYSHVIPGLISKIHDAKVNNKKLILGSKCDVRREFLYSMDLARACVLLMNKFNYEDIKPFINIGTGTDILISDLVTLLCSVIGFKNEIIFGDSIPSGTPQKLLDISKIVELTGWTPTVSLEKGLEYTYDNFLMRL